MFSATFTTCWFAWSAPARESVSGQWRGQVSYLPMQDFLDFLLASPSSYHAAAEVARRLEAVGFERQDETIAFKREPGGHFVVRDGAIIAWFVPRGFSTTDAGFRIIGSHTDSPGLKLKPGESFDSVGWQQASVEVYGGPILSTWFDRELALAGRVVDADGTVRLVHTPPILRVPTLAIHLYRSDDFSVERQAHLQPVFAAEAESQSLRQVLGENMVTHDLITVDTQAPRVFGLNEDFIAAGRLDNLSSVYPSLQALCAAVDGGYDGDDILMLTAFDHEEVGSGSASGAAGPFLEDVLTRICAAHGADVDTRLQMFRRSFCVSADAAHSVHPNYASKHDPVTRPLINQGPVLKMNANQRYGSDAVSSHRFLQACAVADVPAQMFVSNNDVPCGSTIGPLTATRLGIPTVDVGVPLLSMHSAREMCGVYDMEWFEQALTSFYTI